MIQRNIRDKRPPPGMKWKNNLSVLYTNADVLSNKLDELYSLVNLQKPDIVIMTEVLPKHCLNPEAHFFQLSGYNVVYNKHSKRGICINSSSSSKLKYAEVDASFTLELSEVISVEIKLPGISQNVRIVGIYIEAFPEMNLVC